MSSLAAAALLPASPAPPQQLRFDLAYTDVIVVPQAAFPAGYPQHTVDARNWLRVLSATLELITSANVGTRIPQLQIVNNNGVALAAIPQVAGQAAGVDITYTWFPGVGQPFGAMNGNQTAPWPNVWIPATWQIAANVPAALAGDKYGPLTLYVERVPTGPLALAEQLAPVPVLL